MLSKRAIEVLMELCNHPDEFLTGSYLAEKFQVSLRTIQGDMREIKEELKDETCVNIISKTSKGSSVEIKDYEEFSALINTLYQEYSSTILNYSGGRISTLLLVLLNKHRAISLYELEEQLHISSSTLQNDLKKVEDIIRKYDLEVFRSKNRVMIDGPEAGKRRCLFEENLYLRHMKDEEGHLYIDERRITQIRDVLTEVFVKYKYYVMDTDFNNIIFFTNIMLRRIEMGFTVSEEDDDLKLVRDTVEYEIATKIIKKLGRIFLVDPSEQEAMYFSVFIKGKANKQEGDAISAETEKVVEETIEAIRDKFGIDLTSKLNLKIALTLHCMSLEARVKYNMQIKNDMLEYIRESFPIGYDLGSYMGHLLSQKYGKRIIDDEVALLAIHFYSYVLEDRQQQGKKKVLVISTLKKSMTILLRQTLLKWFVNEVSVVDIVNPMDLTDDMLDKYDLFLTTEQSQFYEMGLAMYVNAFPREKDYLNIKLNLDGFKDIDSVTSMFSKELFFVAPSAKKENVIKKICECGAKYCEQENLYQEVMEREGIGSTFFTKDIAVPHPMQAVSSDTFLVVYLSEKPIVWDEDGNQIHLAVLVHVGKNNAQAFQIWDYFAKIFADKQLIKQLLKKPDYENFIECIKKSLESNIQAE